MSQTIKANIQILAILSVATGLLIFLSIAVGTGVQPQIAIAQEPLPSPAAARSSFSKEELAAFGLSLEDIQAAAASFNLRVTINVNPPSVSSPGVATFTIIITNDGPNTAQYILFSQSLPGGMTGGTPNFGSVNAIGNGPNPTVWLITNQITNGNSIQFTVAGTLSSTCSTIATYTASVIPFEAGADTNLSNNTASRGVNVIGQVACMYFPIIRRDPTPTPSPVVVFFDNFSGTQNWSTSDDSDCERTYSNGEYEITAKTRDKNCFGPAPKAAEGTQYGTFKVKARRDDGGSNFTVAIYANGQGDANYYAFEVKPNDDCSWRLIRRRDGNSSTVRNGGCESAINKGSASNILEIRHTSNGNISVFINGTQVGSTYNDGSQLTGRATGVYARTSNDDDVAVRFDDFTVIRP